MTLLANDTEHDVDAGDSKRDQRRMNTLKKKICLVLTILLVVSMFTACGTSTPAATATPAAESTAAETKTAETTAATAEASAPPADKNAEEFTISVSGWFLGDLTDEKNPQKKYTDYAISKYKEIYPNATVQVNNLAGEKYLDVIKAKMASATADEVVFHQANLLFSKAGYLEDLSGFDFVQNVQEAAKPSVTYQGKYFSAPQTMQTFGMFYNKKIFEDNGIAVPANWTEFLAVCEKLKTAGVVPLGSGYKDAWVINATFNNVFIPNFILADNPNFLVDLYNRKVKMNSPEMKNVITKFVELIEKGYYPKGLFSTDWMASGAEFGHGKTAMLIQGAWLPGMLDSEATFMGEGAIGSANCGYVPFAGESGKPVVSLGTDHLLSINAQAPDKQRAKDLFLALLSEEALQFACSDLAFPGIKSKVTHTLPAYTDIQNALDKHTSSVAGNSFMPESVSNELIAVVQKAMAGQGIKDADLDALDKLYDQDIGMAVAP